MLDIQFIRENPELIKKTAASKKVTVDVDQLLQLDTQYRDHLDQINQLRHQRNVASKQNQNAKPTPEQIEQGKALKSQIALLETELEHIQSQLQALHLAIPNIPSDDTPEGKDESENKVVKKVGEPPVFNFTPKEHWELGEKLDLIDSERAAKTSGSRFVFLKGDLVLLQFALLQHAFKTLTDRETLAKIISDAGLNVEPTPFIPVVPPVLIRPQPFAQMARLEPREERYYIPSDDMYLIGSAEHTLGAMHLNETFTEKQLPLRYIGYSTAFRREAGSYGKDTKGILRVHQFDKLEMESFTLPELSIQEQDFFVAIQEYLMSSLGLPYQVVAICTGDMGGPDARQRDIETWMPGQNRYRETHTSDLMTDYQSRRLNIKVTRKSGDSQYVHMNDATAYAIGRTIIGIMENYQQSDGTIGIPEVLQPYMGKSRIG